MTMVKGLAIVALLVGGTSLAMAQNGPATGGEPPVMGGAAGNPATAISLTFRSVAVTLLSSARVTASSWLPVP